MRTSPCLRHCCIRKCTASYGHHMRLAQVVTGTASCILRHYFFFWFWNKSAFVIRKFECWIERSGYEPLESISRDVKKKDFSEVATYHVYRAAPQFGHNCITCSGTNLVTGSQIDINNVAHTLIPPQRVLSSKNTRASAILLSTQPQWLLKWW